MPPGQDQSTTVSVDFDGKKIPARAGQTVAAALLDAGVRIFSRSVKYHRPRGPWCFAGRCSHCLMRVSGVPNVMTCRAEVSEGCRVSVQNVMGSAKVDMLGTIDWLFPRGLDHHAMFAGVPVVEKAVAVVARHLAGLGKLPDASTSPPRAPEELHPEIAVIGAGPAGIAFAKAASGSGRRVMVFDEESEPGGLAGWIRTEADDLALQSSIAALPSAGVELRLGHTALGYYRDERGPFVAMVAARPEPRVVRVYARVLGICTGGQEPLWPFPGNDLPGIHAGRGFARFVAREGVDVGRKVVVVGSHPDAEGVAGALTCSGVKVATLVDVGGRLGVSKHWERLAAQVVEEARGGRRVEKVVVNDGARKKVLGCDTVALCGPTTPAFELASQAGCELVAHEASGGFAVRTGSDGATSVPGVFAAGHVCGAANARSATEQGRLAGANAARLAETARS